MQPPSDLRTQRSPGPRPFTGIRLCGPLSNPRSPLRSQTLCLIILRLRHSHDPKLYILTQKPLTLDNCHVEWQNRSRSPLSCHMTVQYQHFQFASSKPDTHDSADLIMKSCAKQLQGRLVRGLVSGRALVTTLRAQYETTDSLLKV